MRTVLTAIFLKLICNDMTDITKQFSSPVQLEERPSGASWVVESSLQAWEPCWGASDPSVAFP